MISENILPTFFFLSFPIDQPLSFQKQVMVAAMAAVYLSAQKFSSERSSSNGDDDGDGRRRFKRGLRATERDD